MENKENAKCQYCKGTDWLVLPAMKGAVPCDHGKDARSWICADAGTPANGKTSIEIPCPRCGRCGFIKDAEMNLDGVCPVCNGKGQMPRDIAGGSWEEQCLAARELKNLFLEESARLRDEKSELIKIAWVIHEHASGPIPWGGCKCDHGEDGRSLLKGEKCERCKALERLKQISHK